MQCYKTYGRDNRHAPSAGCHTLRERTKVRDCRKMLSLLIHLGRRISMEGYPADNRQRGSDNHAAVTSKSMVENQHPVHGLIRADLQGRHFNCVLEGSVNSPRWTKIRCLSPQQPWNTDQEATVMMMATEGARVWSFSLNTFMASRN